MNLAEYGPLDAQRPMKKAPSLDRERKSEPSDLASRVMPRSIN
jgi:hypothetical protein